MFLSPSIFVADFSGFLFHPIFAVSTCQNDTDTTHVNKRRNKEIFTQKRSENIVKLPQIRRKNCESLKVINNGVGGRSF